MTRFVILEHDHPTQHWDLMLEAGEVLRTWRLAEPPRHGAAIAAVAVFDHRLLYLDYEGPISGNRGRVIRWDAGAFDWRERKDERVIVQLHGLQLRGTLHLRRTNAENWEGDFFADG